MNSFYERHREEDTALHIQRNHSNRFPAHFHSNLEVVIVKRGEKILQINGEEYLADSGSVTVKYAYMPAIKTVEDELDIGLGVTMQALAFGAAAEYCFMNGLYGEAEGWNKKYRAEIATSYRARPAKSIKERRWA